MSVKGAREFMEAVAGIGGRPLEPSRGGTTAPGGSPAPSSTKLGTIDTGWNGSGYPRVLFDGEGLMGVKGYPWLGVAPRPGDRVLLVPVGNSYVISGPVHGAGPVQGDRRLNPATGGYEQYYDAYNATSNPGGSVAGAGWYADDTGDIAVSSIGFQNGFTTNNPPATFRRVNGWIYSAGTVNVPGNNRTGTVWTMPLGFRPSVRHAILTQASAIIRNEMKFNTDGTVVFENFVQNSSVVAFEASYPVRQ